MPVLFLWKSRSGANITGARLFQKPIVLFTAKRAAAGNANLFQTAITALPYQNQNAKIS